MKATALEQNIVLQNREHIVISGTKDVENYDENHISLSTELGGLLIEGDDLKIINLCVQSGELEVRGYISALIYTDLPREKDGFFARLFR